MNDAYPNATTSLAARCDALVRRFDPYEIGEPPARCDTAPMPGACATCLYLSGLRCANADRVRDWPRWMVAGDCPSWWPRHRNRG